LVVLKRGAAPRLRGSRQCLVLVGWLVILKRGAAPRLRGSRQCSELPTERADSERRPRRLPRCDHRTAPSSVPPSTSRVARAAPPPAPAHALQHTLGVARGAVPHAVAGPLAHTPEQPAPHSGCRVRRCARTPPPRMASQDLHDRPVPHAPRLHLRSVWPTPLMPMRRTSRTDLVAVAPAGRCCRGAAERRDGGGFNDGGAPARSTHPCVTPPPPASFLGLLRTQRR
jgi:hypothetical protein